MSLLARTAATGAAALDGRFLALSSSLDRDRALLTEDVLGSVAHALGLRRAGLLTAGEAAALRAGLLAVLDEVREGSAGLPEEEDVHMAVEAALGQRVGAVAGKLHTGRSRNDQIALDLQLHLREATRRAGLSLISLIEALCELAQVYEETLLPGYTHRQRAIPITVGHWAMAGGAALSRDCALLRFTLSQLDRCPLGAGALAGSSLPLPRAHVAGLLGFGAPSENSLDTVGDRDAVSAVGYLSARLHVHMSRLATDVVDFSSREFGFVQLDEAIACGSSMMPHKKNPDLFELVRGRSAQALGDLMTSLSLARGLPLGYQRDLQEDRAVVTGLGAHLCGTLELLCLGLRHIRINPAATSAALLSDATQATDLAEVLVQQGGVPFRQAYRMVGALVAWARQAGRPLASLSEDELRAGLGELPGDLAPVLPALVARLDPHACVAARALPGGPAPEAVRAQVAAVQAAAGELAAALGGVPTLEGLRARLEATPL